jgi:hypothetical protein
MAAVAAATAYAGITALLFYNLLPVVTTHLYSDLGDPLLNVAFLEWNARHLPLSGEWWNFPAFAPLGGVTAFTEHLLAAYPLASPVIWLTGNPVLAHNLVLLLAFPLNGLAAYLLGRELTGSALAGFVAGLAFAFAPYHSNHLSHIQTLSVFGMPIALLGLHRYLRSRDQGPGIRDQRYGGVPAPDPRSPIPSATCSLVLFAIGWLFTALANAYVLVFFPVLVLLWCLWFIRPGEWRRLAAIGITALIASLPLIPLLAGYRSRQNAYGFTRGFNEVREFAADVISLIAVSPRELLWRGVLPRTYEESSLFPGLTIVMLAIVAVGVVYRSRRVDGSSSRWPARLLMLAGVLTVVVLARLWTGPFGWRLGPLPLPPFTPSWLFTAAVAAAVAGAATSNLVRDAWRRRDPIVFYAAAAIVLWLLALGPQPEWSRARVRALAYGPYFLLMYLPGFSSVRVPARMWLPAMVCLSALAGYAAAALSARVGASRLRQAALAAVLCAGILAEGWFYEKTVLVPPPMPAGVVPAGALVLDLPIDEGFWGALPQYRAVRGGYRSVNGYAGYGPGYYLPLRRAIADRLPDALRPFRRLAELHVIVRPGTPPAVVRWIAEEPGARRTHGSPGLQIFVLPRLDPDQPRRRLPLSVADSTVFGRGY